MCPSTRVFIVICLWILHAASAHLMHYVARECENSVLPLNCPRGYTMHFTAAFYGRNDTEFCTGDNPVAANSTTCSLTNALGIVDRECGGKQSCGILVNGDTFQPDPCPGTSKFILLRFYCSEETHIRSACRGRELTIDCHNNSVIHVSKVTYSGIYSDTCTDDATITNPNCTSPSAFHTLSDLCNNKEECRFAVTGSLLGDPCPGSSKHLQIFYTCSACENIYKGNADNCDYWAHHGECTANPDWMRAYCRRSCWNCDRRQSCRNIYYDGQCDYHAAYGDCISPESAISRWVTSNCKRSCNRCTGESVLPPSPTPPVVTGQPDLSTTTPYVPSSGYLTETLCGGDIGYLLCEPHEGLRIYDAFFGRKNNLTCQHDTLANTDCPNEDNVLETIATTCQGRRYCHPSANEFIFGDTKCPGTYKYLDIKYKCQVCENALGDDTQCELLARQGACSHNKVFMLDNCFRTCSACHVSECPNINGDDRMCDSWAMDKECNINPVWMSLNCRESCRLCNTEVPRNMSTVPPPTTPSMGVTPQHKDPVDVVFCAGESINLQCSMGYGILITSGFYGRSDPSVCPGRDASVQCNDTTTLPTLQRMCNGAINCFIEDVSLFLGDPCPGTSKYTLITYQCAHSSEFTCMPSCGEHAVCISRNTCVCEPGYSGDSCSPANCEGINHCHGHGTCISANECSCTDGWVGPECDVPDCSAVNQCSGYGTCVQPNTCRCYPYRTGDDCGTCFASFATGPSCLPCPPCYRGTCEFNEGDGVSPFMGCYHDNVGARDLQTLMWSANQQSTITKCMSACRINGFLYAGLQNGTECYCGNEYGRYGLSTSCRRPCSGEQSEYCGGYTANSVWRTYEGSCQCDGPNWTGEFCHLCSPGYNGSECTSSDGSSHPTTSATSSTSSPDTSSQLPSKTFSTEIVINMQWENGYLDINSAESKGLVNFLQPKLLDVYTRFSKNVTDVKINGFRSGSVIVDHTVYVSNFWANPEVIKQKAVCYVSQTNDTLITFGELTPRVQTKNERICQEMASFCGQNGELNMPTLSNSTWSCTCKNGTSGPRCEFSSVEIFKIVIIVVICVLVPCFIGLIVCCVVRYKHFKTVHVSAPSSSIIPLSSVSLSKAFKGSKRKLFDDQKLTENEDNYGFFPTQI